MNKKPPHLRLIKSESFIEPEAKIEEGVYEKTFYYDLNIGGECTLKGEDPKLLEELCRKGFSIIEDPIFKEEICQVVYDLIARRLEEDEPLIES